MDEKTRFGERLKAAMISAGHEPKPGFLHKQFNSRWWGKPVSFQAVRDWLAGISIPTQDKLQVLAEWLNLHPQVLRFGEQATRETKEPAAAWKNGVSLQDRATIDALLALPAAKRKLVSELIKALTPPEK